MTYTFDLIVAFLENYDSIEAFIERTTNELFKVNYDYADQDDFWNQEGNTLQDRGSHNTRIPKQDRLKETLIVMKADIDKSIKILPMEHQIAIWYHYQLAPTKANNRKNSSVLAEEAVQMIAENLNDG